MYYFKRFLIVLLISMLGMVMKVKYISSNDIPSIVAGQSGTPKIDFVDVSSWNGNLLFDDFKKIKNYGVKGVIVKLIEGKYYLNPNARLQINNARQAGLKIAVYHYSKFDSSSEAVLEADYFLKHVKQFGLSRETVLVNDLEDSQTQRSTVTANAVAFRNRLVTSGYSKHMVYTPPNYITLTKFDVRLFGNRNIWMASYPYQPTSNNLWHTQYGAWQWNSKTSFPGVSGLFDVSVDYGSIFLQQSKTIRRQNIPINRVQQRKHNNISGYHHDGKGWYWLENGKRYTGFKHYMGKYYWFINGVRQKNQWKKNGGYCYYFGSNGQAVQGINKIGRYQYYFGENGAYFLHTNKIVKIKGQAFHANMQGVLTPYQGYLNTNIGWRWYEKGKLYTGRRYYRGSYYWFNKGERQNNQWRQDGKYRYYFGINGKAVQGINKIGRYQYYFSEDGTYFLRINKFLTIRGQIYYANAQGVLTPWKGYVRTSMGWRWYEKGKPYTGFRYYKGSYHWFNKGKLQNNKWKKPRAYIN